MSTAKYFTDKAAASQRAPSGSGAGRLNANSLAQVREQAASMSQRVDQIMKAPKVDGRPEMYRIDPRMDDDLRRLHEQQALRDPEIAPHPLFRPVHGARDMHAVQYDFLGAAEVVSVGGTSSAASHPVAAAGEDHHTQKRHFGRPEARAAYETPAAPTSGGRVSPLHQRKHFTAATNVNNNTGASETASVASGRVSPTTSGRLISPRAYANSGDILTIASSPVRRVNSGRSVQSSGSTTYELVGLPSNAQHHHREQPSHHETKSTTATTATSVEVQTVAAPAPMAAPTSSPSAVVETAAPKAAPSDRLASPQRPPLAVAIGNNFPAARGASAVAVPRSSIRQKITIDKFEALQPRPQLTTNRVASQSPRRPGVMLDFSHDSHFLSFSETEHCSGRVGCRSPRIMTVGKVTCPIRPLSAPRASPQRSHSPASSNPNVVSPAPAPYKRLSRSVTPPGGRRGSSGIFDPPATARRVEPNANANAMGMRKKSLLSTELLNANRLTSADNTLKSPSLDGTTAVQHAAAHCSPMLKRTMSSLQTSVARVPDNLLKSVIPTKDHVSRKMRVCSPHAAQLRSSQIGGLLSWQ